MNEGLTGELGDAGIPIDSVTVQPTLQAVIKTFVSGKLPPAEWVRVAIEAGQIDDFTSDSDTVLLKMTDWIYDNPEILEVDDYIFVEFDIVDEVALLNIHRTLDLGGDEVLVESSWTCEVAAEGFNQPRIGENLWMELEFRFNSIVQVDKGRFVVRSHEVNHVELAEY